jgi:hypothetical protein
MEPDDLPDTAARGDRFALPSETAKRLDDAVVALNYLQQVWCLAH